MRKYFTVAILICAGLLSLYMREAEEFTHTGQAMNTIIRMTIYGHDERVLDDAFTLLNELDATLSMYNPSSDISRINATGSMNVQPTTVEAVNDSVRLHALTAGVFNPLIGAVTGLWKINRKEGSVPTPESLDYAVKLANISNLTISGDNISLRHEGCVLDLGGIAKGYASVKIAELLRDKGIKSAIIDLGGNVYAVGAKDDGSKWRIGIRNPLDPYGMPAVVVDVADSAVITSGNYERFKTIDGKKYSHFFDPSTGNSVMSDLLSVTVITSDGSLADGLATAFMITGVERAFELLKGIEPAPGVLFITQSGITATSNLRGIITKSAGSVNFRDIM
ncbi:MAG: FAD:protein FMN transferase [Synergistaceae bacterium]|nr:FAD:protein FMN transferase [Synergistaceae bacterium]